MVLASIVSKEKNTIKMVAVLLYLQKHGHLKWIFLSGSTWKTFFFFFFGVAFFFFK